MTGATAALARLDAGQPVRLFIGDGLDAIEIVLTASFQESLAAKLRAELEIAAWNERARVTLSIDAEPFSEQLTSCRRSLAAPSGGQPASPSDPNQQTAGETAERTD